MKDFESNPDIEVERAAGGATLKARHKRYGHWAVYSWPETGGADMVFQQGHCNDEHYWTYDRFRIDAHIAVNAHARELGGLNE